MGNSFSACEIVELGVQIEKNGKAFYSTLSEMAGNPEVQGVFKHLADEEEKHMNILHKVFDASCSYEPGGAYPEEYFAYMNAVASDYVFTKKDAGRDMAKNVKDTQEAVVLAIKLEKDSIVFYEGMKEMMAETDQQVVDTVIAEEKKHLKRLADLRSELEGE